MRVILTTWNSWAITGRKKCHINKILIGHNHSFSKKGILLLITKILWTIIMIIVLILRTIMLIKMIIITTTANAIEGSQNVRQEGAKGGGGERKRRHRSRGIGLERIRVERQGKEGEDGKKGVRKFGKEGKESRSYRRGGREEKKRVWEEGRREERREEGKGKGITQ